jgi:hypothetical protein
LPPIWKVLLKLIYSVFYKLPKGGMQAITFEKELKCA